MLLPLEAIDMLRKSPFALWIPGVVLFVLPLVMAACADSAPTPFPTSSVPTFAPPPTLNPAGDAGHGAVLFAAWRCAQCHGDTAQGALGPRLARTSLSTASFAAAIRQTRPPKPAFSTSELSDADVRDIYAWLQTLTVDAVRADVTPDGTALPDGQVLGILVYTQNGCDQCHGAFAQGSSDSPALAGYSQDVDTFLSLMSSTATSVPEHDLARYDVAFLRRLYNWLREGAAPDSGC